MRILQETLGLKKFDVYFAIKITALLLIGFPSQAESTYASERVAFETPPIQPSAFRLKRAKSEGKTLEPTPGTPLTGLLLKPTGIGPHPAIVLLPQSVEARPSYLEWADHLAENGFVTLFVESLISRDVKILRDDKPMNLQSDAQGAYTYLSTLSFVDANRIGLLGFGLSGNFVQRSLDAEYVRQVDSFPFFAGATLYPNCDAEMELVAPFLILAGEVDKRMSLATCRTMIDANAKIDGRTKLKLYPAATHFFDNVAYSKRSDQRGEAWTKPAWYSDNHYDPAAHAASKQEIVNFFQSAAAPN